MSSNIFLFILFEKTLKKSINMQNNILLIEYGEKKDFNVNNFFSTNKLLR